MKKNLPGDKFLLHVFSVTINAFSCENFQRLVVYNANLDSKKLSIDLPLEAVVPTSPMLLSIHLKPSD